MTNQEILQKVKNEFSIDFVEKDETLLGLIDAVKDVARRISGYDFETEAMPLGIANSIAENVGKKFDDGGFVMDVSVFQMYNKRPMF